MEMCGNLHRDFVQTMLMHHRHGVEMAKIQVEQGSDSEAKEFREPDQGDYAARELVFVSTRWETG